MSEENVETVRKLYAAIARKDKEGVFNCYHPDVEWHDHAWLDYEGVRRGLEGVRAVHREFFGPFKTFTYELHDFVDIGDRVVVTVHVIGRGRASGVEVEREVPVVFTFREGKIARTELFANRDAALEAAGLSE
jgi:ketosteroid isomerase-like protein